jgi:co-chaperonin GroES (HSP10)
MISENNLDMTAAKNAVEEMKDKAPKVVFKKTAKELANQEKADAKAKEDAAKAVQEAKSLADAYAAKPRLNPEAIGKTLLDRMPNPTGWRILILPYQGKGKTAGGIFLPTETVERGQISTQVGYVLKLGPLAYKDTAKFPSGPWCAEKQWVMFARYAGSRFQIDGGEVRILNDDEILSTILDPEDIHQLS